MTRILYTTTHGTDNPTSAGLVFVAANGASDAGHQPEIALQADATLLLKDSVAAVTTPVGWPVISDLLATAISHNTPIHV